MKYVAVLLLVSAPAFASPRLTTKQSKDLLAHVADQLKSAAQHLPDNWSSQPTPPFPEGTSWVVYGFGTHYSAQIADGLRVGTVFAAARAKDGAIAVEALVPAITELGIQGVRPIVPARGSEWPIGDEYDAAYAAIMNGDAQDKKTKDVVHRVYCAWQRGNGVIAAHLPNNTMQFLDELGCTR